MDNLEKKLKEMTETLQEMGKDKNKKQTKWLKRLFLVFSIGMAIFTKTWLWLVLPFAFSLAIVYLVLFSLSIMSLTFFQSQLTKQELIVCGIMFSFGLVGYILIKGLFLINPTVSLCVLALVLLKQGMTFIK